MMARSEFLLSVSHGQISVFDSSLPDPFNEWTDQHFAQGFTWRPGSVSFATLEESGPHYVIVASALSFDEPSAYAVRVIDVPFEVPASGQIEVASIADSVLLRIEHGVYQLRFQNMRRDDNGNPVVRLSFSGSLSPVFSVVRTDTVLRIGQELLLEASPA